MTNPIETIITTLNQSARKMEDRGRPKEAEGQRQLADALDYINQTLNADKRLAPQPEHTFEPWDCVRAKEGTEAYRYVGDTDLVVGMHDDPDYVSVFDPDSGERFGVDCDDLIFVRRLKPRLQSPQPVFKAGDTVLDVVRDVLVTIREVHSRWYSVETGGGEVYDLSTHLADPIKDKPAPLHVGDWVRHKYSGKIFQISSVAGEQIYGMLEGATMATMQEFVEKIDPPAPRFTFGDRVSSHANKGIAYRFIHYQGEHMAEVYNEESDCIYMTAAKNLYLDTTAD